jgi:hypothetical protein
LAILVVRQKILDFTTAKATSFIFQRTDWEIVQNIFSWGYKTGIEFSASKDGAMNGQMTNVNLDGVDIGIHLRETKPEGIAISNLSIANDGRGTDRIAVWARMGANRACLTIRGGSFWGHLNQVVRWEAPGALSLSDSRIVPFEAPRPVIEILQGHANIHDNNLGPYPGTHWSKPAVAISVGPKVGRAIIHDNEFSGWRILNQGRDRVDLHNNY